MQQAVERHNRRSREGLAIRVGLSMGEATEEDGDYFGDPVIEASRLCAHAAAGQILTTEMVRAIAGRHSAQDLVARGSTVLKGLPEPVEVVEVLWDLGPEPDDVGAQLPLRPPDRHLRGHVLRLLRARKRAVTHRRYPQEIGRRASSRRVARLGRAGHRQDHARGQGRQGSPRGGIQRPLRRCRGGSGDSLPTLGAALSNLVDALPADSLGQFAEENGLALARLVPAVARIVGDEAPAPGTDADAERFMIMGSAVRLLAFASRTTPIVVVLDDLHWADARPTLQLLRHLVGSLPAHARHRGRHLP